MCWDRGLFGQNQLVFMPLPPSCCWVWGAHQLRGLLGCHGPRGSVGGFLPSPWGVCVCAWHFCVFVVKRLHVPPSDEAVGQGVCVPGPCLQGIEGAGGTAELEKV